MCENEPCGADMLEIEDIYNTEPTILLNLINKSVDVQLMKKHTYSGFVSAIDPISRSVVLSIPKEEAYETVLIPGHAIIKIIQTNTQSIPPKRKQSIDISDEDIEKRKRIIKAWLQKSLIVLEEGDNCLKFGNISIIPPYGVEDILTDNIVVYRSIQNMLKKIPDSFKDEFI